MDESGARLALLREAKAGNREAEEAFVTQNLGLVHSIVARFSGAHDREELFQIGCLGLVHALRRFDFTYNVAFSTYAVPVILGEVRQFLRRDGTVHLSRSLKERGLAVSRGENALSQRLGRTPTVSELAEELGLAPGEVAEAMEAGQVCSLSELAEVLALPEEDWAEQVDLSQAMQTLSERQRQLLRLRFSADQTQSQVARLFGVSQVQVSRLERRAIIQLQKNLIGEDDELDRG